MATSTYGTPYVQGSDLVSAYPTVSSSLATRVDEVSYRGNGLNAQTGTTYTLVAGDAGKTITLSNASPVAVTLPQDSTADLPDGAVVSFYNLGAGAVTISQGTGATLQGGSITLAQYEVTSVIKLSANTYGRYDGAPAAGVSLVTPTSIANSGGTATATGGAVTFSAVTSVSLNGIFSSTYENYRALVTLTVSAGMNVFWRLRAAGTDNTASSYNRQAVFAFNASASAVNDLNQAQWEMINVTTTFAPATFIGDIFGPNLAVRTKVLQPYGPLVEASGTQWRTGIAGLTHDVTTAYDGLTMYASTGNITGTIRVYGYKN